MPPLNLDDAGNDEIHPFNPGDMENGEMQQGDPVTVMKRHELSQATGGKMEHCQLTPVAWNGEIQPGAPGNEENSGFLRMAEFSLPV